MNGLSHYAPYKTALKEAGLRVAGTKKQGKRTIITVFRPGPGAGKPAHPATPKPPRVES